MARVSYLLSWFFFCLAGVLITLATLAVPENAFADAGGDWCNTYCSGVCSGDPSCYARCFGPCHDGYYTCSDCSNYSGDQYTWCVGGCKAGDNLGPFCENFCTCSSIRDCDDSNLCLVPMSVPAAESMKIGSRLLC